MSQRWRKERKRDPYHRLAKRHGYRSRALFKLRQIDSRFNLIRKDMRIVDLGAAPGGWTQYVADKVGKKGLVVAVDLRELDPLPHKNVKTLQIDISDEEAPKRILEVANGRVDMVLSDLSPSLSGVWEVDVARQVDLSLRALKMAKRILKRSGSMVLKVFEGMDSWRVVEELRKGFSTVKLFKPPASRKRSAEIYAVGLDFK